MSEEVQANLIEAVEDFEQAGIWPDAESITAIPGHEWFEITTKDAAAWALRKMAKIKAEKEENILTAQEEIKRIDDWCQSENDKLRGSLNFFEYLLFGYMQQVRQADPSVKTIRLPHGALKMRAQQSEWTTYDDEALLVWAKESLPGAVVVKESVARWQVKDWIKETGEVVPGVVITERPEKFSVEVI
jgi:hypothetical protein